MATTLELVDLPPHGSEGQDHEIIDCIDEPQLRERTAAHPLHNAHRDAVRALKMSPDRRLLASASNDHTVRVWDAETLECLHTLTGHTDSVRVLAFAAHNSGNNTSSSATILLSAGRDHTVKVHRVPRVPCRVRVGLRGLLTAVALTDLGRRQGPVAALAAYV